MITPVMKQCWIACGVFLAFFGHGMMLSYSSCLLPALRAPDSTIKIDLDSASWLASSVGASMMPSFIITSVFMDRVGRRWVFAAATLLHVTTWLVIYFATNVTTLMIGRLVGGLSAGGIYCCGSTITAEYTDPEIRGVFLNIKSLSIFCGYVYMHIVSHFVNWRNVALLSALPCMVSFLMNLTWPESPSWLISKNRIKKAESIFYCLRGREDKAVKEIEKLILIQKSRMSRILKTASFAEKISNFMKKFKDRSFLQPLALIFFGKILCETSGRHFFPAYAMDVIAEVTKDKANALYYILCIDVITLASCTSSCILIKVVGRKTLLFFSGITSTVLLIGISLTTFSISRGIVLIGGPWLVPSLVGIYFILANLGCTVIPYVLYAEIFPLAYRESGAGAGGFILSFTFFIYLKVLPYLLTYLKIYGTFAIFSVIMTISLVVLYFIMPETRNRTLVEIEEYFIHGRFADDEDQVLNSDRDAEKESMLTS